MSKFIKYVIFVCLFVYIVFLSIELKGNNENTFDVGKDTIETWGNGEYQLLNSSNKVGLFNCKYHECILPIVNAWIQKDKYVYVIGEYPVTFNNIAKIKTKIDTTSNIIYYYSEKINFDELNIVYANSMLENNKLVVVNDYDFFSDDEKEIFMNLNNGENVYHRE